MWLVAIAVANLDLEWALDNFSETTVAYSGGCQKMTAHMCRPTNSGSCVIIWAQVNQRVRRNTVSREQPCHGLVIPQ